MKLQMITPEQLLNGAEDGEQKALFCRAALSVGKYPQLRWLHHVPNGGQRNKREGASLKAQGVKRGISDIVLPYPAKMPHIQDWRDGHYHGLYVELKTEKRRKEKNGGCSDEQLEFLDYANKVGYKAVVAYGWKDAWRAIESYLNGE
jgi:hypothetical protein